MNIKKRLVISNTVTIILPILITLIVAIIYLNITFKVFNRGINYNSFQKLAKVREEMADLSKGIAKDNLNIDEIAKVQDFLSQRLSKISGQFIITKGNNAAAISKNISMFDAQRCINEINRQPIDTLVNINDISYMIDVTNVKYNDNSFGSIILMVPTGDGIDSIKLFFIIIIVTFILSSIMVNVISSYLFSKRIVGPITNLKMAAAEISNGNLNCEIIEQGDSEIEELCHDFEKMRIQLKDSVHMKFKYDDDRKMLVSSISHDLKTPITSIKGYVEGILDGVANTDEKRHNYLKTIYSKAQQMDGMIDDLLLYSKLDMNQIPFNFRKTSIIEYFRYCIEECALELKKYNIEINLINNLAGSPYVMMDMERMRRVIVNIIDNSRKYMNKEKGKIDIMLRETDLSIIIEIRDNGAGINKEDINNIFERFYRADSARSGVKGSGLGLAIAKQIVEGHKGKIWAISHGTEGTSVLISLAKLMNG